MNSFTFFFAIYVFATFAVAYYFRNKMQSSNFLNEYFIANRGLKGFALAMTTVATYTSASSFIGGAGAAFNYGLGWILIAMVQVPSLWLAMGVIGKRAAYLAHKHNVLTINELLFVRYKSRLLSNLCSLALIVSFIGAMTVQIIAGARLLESNLQINYSVSLLIFASVIAIYSLIGGFKAVVYTDIIQGLIMLIGLIALLAMTLYKVGGLEAAINTIQTANPQLLEVNNGPVSYYLLASLWVLVCFAIVGLPQMAIRSLTFKEQKSLNNALIIGTIGLALMMFTIHFLGFLARALLDSNTTRDLVMPNLIQAVFPPYLAFLLFIMPMAAIMSTLDSQLIQTSATLVKDIYFNNQTGVQELSKEEQLAQLNNKGNIQKIIRLSMLAIVALLVIFSLNPPDSIVWLNLLAVGGLEAAFLWPLIFALFYKKANAGGAVASMLTGFSSYIFLTITKISFFSLHQIVPALVFGFIAFVVVNPFFTKKSN